MNNTILVEAPSLHNLYHLVTLDKGLSSTRSTPWLSIVCLVIASVLAIVKLFEKTGNALFNAPFIGVKTAWLARWLFFQSGEKTIQQGHTAYHDKPWKLTGNDVIVLPHK